MSTVSRGARSPLRAPVSGRGSRDAVTLIVPMPRLVDALPHLGVEDHTSRATVAVAFLRDVLSAARASALINDTVIVSPDRLLADEAGRFGARGVASDGGSVVSLLKQARLVEGPSLVISYDLPCVDSLDLTTVVTHMRGRWRAVHAADLHGPDPTVVGSCYPDVLPDVAVGQPLGAARGSAGVSNDLLGIRCRVQSAADLSVAASLGLGRHSNRAAEDLQLLGDRRARFASKKWI